MNRTAQVVHLARRAGLLLAFAAAAVAHGEELYPERIVTMEQMKLASGPMELKVPKATVKRSKTFSTLVIVSHVAKDGSVVRSKIDQASGSPHLDEAALPSMRGVRFVPFEGDGQPEAVSVVIPMRLPFQDVPRDRR